MFYLLIEYSSFMSRNIFPFVPSKTFDYFKSVNIMKTLNNIFTTFKNFKFNLDAADMTVRKNLVHLEIMKNPRNTSESIISSIYAKQNFQ